MGVPFEIVRTMGKREHTLRYTLGGATHQGTLAQVQDQIDASLRCVQLSRIAFFGQHLGGGILDKTGASEGHFWTPRLGEGGLTAAGAFP